MGEPLIVEHTLFVPRELVFDAWTDAGQVGAWFVPDAARGGAAMVTAEPGGGFEVAWTDSDGSGRRESGRFTRVTAPAALALTLDGDYGGGDLSLTLHDERGACRLVLRQTGVEDDAMERVRAEWQARFERLEAYFSVI